MRQASLAALVKIAPQDPTVKTTVMRALDDSNPFVRGEALRALVAIPDITAQELAYDAA